MPITDITNAVAQVGLPVGLIVWGIWFLTVKVWPWVADDRRRALDREVEQSKSAALVAVARAIEVMAAVLNSSGQENRPGSP